MTITPKEKELAAVAISVAAGCKPCTDHHVKVARKARASDAEIRQAADNALAIRRTAADIMEGHASAHLGKKSEQPRFEAAGDVSRVEALASLGVAFAVNCVSSLEHYLAAAEIAGVPQDDISQIVELAAFIKQKAASHVERAAGTSKQKAA